jgi:amino-acid N-acetyltransferase
VLLGHELVSLYESVPEFLVAVNEAGTVVGAGALHVMWEDLAEVRSVVVSESLRGTGIGHAVLEGLLAKAKALGIKRVFCLTFETEFFGKQGFEVISDVPVDEATFEQMVRSHDDGVAEFLDLARVKQNTLGNTRMLKSL